MGRRHPFTVTAWWRSHLGGRFEFINVMAREEWRATGLSLQRQLACASTGRQEVYQHLWTGEPSASR
jgi:hypothetical protein